MKKWKNLFKKQQAQESNDDLVTVKVKPDTYQVVLTISRDGKSADLTQLEKGSQIPINLLLNGLLLVYNQALGELAVRSYLQKQKGTETDAGKEA